MKTVIRNTTIADKLLFLILITASVAGIFFSREAMPQGPDIVITVDGKPLYTLPRDKDRLVSIPGPFGDTVVEIKDGKVRVKEAHCPNRLCEKQGWISRGAIVCLPNHIVITVGGKAGDLPRGIDAVTG
ncbi:MAG: NusG domain II-containing protein [Nitrospiraceae bacterium]|nr:NusG domain II-containing protein [Nitrospiraceae bacterium]